MSWQRHLPSTSRCFCCSTGPCSSMLWRRCWLGGRKGIRPEKNWVVGCWRGYLSGARCRLAYGPLSLASVKSRLVVPSWYRITRVVPDKGPLNGCVCILVSAASNFVTFFRSSSDRLQSDTDSRDQLIGAVGPGSSGRHPHAVSWRPEGITRHDPCQSTRSRYAQGTKPATRRCIAEQQLRCVIHLQHQTAVSCSIQYLELPSVLWHCLFAAGLTPWFYAASVVAFSII